MKVSVGQCVNGLCRPESRDECLLGMVSGRLSPMLEL